MQLNEVIKNLYKAIFPFGNESVEYYFSSIDKIENSFDLDFLNKELYLMESYKRSFDSLMRNLEFFEDINISVNFRTKRDIGNRVFIEKNEKSIDVYFDKPIADYSNLNYHIINGEMLIIIEKIEERIDWLSIDIEISK